MLKKFRYKEVTWLDLESPTPAETAELGKAYDLHPTLLAELERPSPRPKLELFNQCVYLILHFPGAGSDVQEVDFIIGQNFIITTHYALVNPLNDFAKIFEADLTLKRHPDQLHAGFLFFYILKEIYNTLGADLNFINDRLRQVEQKVFSGREREVVTELAEINRRLLDFRWSLQSHREILAALGEPGEEMFGAKFRYYLQTIQGEHERVWRSVENNRATFFDLRETNDSLLSIKTNETMRTLTVGAFVLLQMTIIAQLFGISTNYIPLANHRLVFPIVVGLTLIASFATYLVARLKKWI